MISLQAFYAFHIAFLVEFGPVRKNARIVLRCSTNLSREVFMSDGTILVVSNELSFARTLRIILAAKGYEVVNTASVDDAVRPSDFCEYDLVLLDNDTSFPTTVEACREIRACSDVAIVIISSDNSEETKSRAFLAGANAYIPKPFGVAEIFASAREYAQGQDNTLPSSGELESFSLRLT
jgi:DNA-binding response OmpR family regulator